MKKSTLCLAVSLAALSALPLVAGSLEERARKIVIHHIEMEEATPREVLDFLRAQARERDPQGKGINIIYKLSPQGKRIIDQPMLTLNMDNVPLTEVVRYVHLLTGLHCRFGKVALLVFDSAAAGNAMTTRIYDLNAGVVDSRPTRGKAETIDGWDHNDD